MSSETPAPKQFPNGSTRAGRVAGFLIVIAGIFLGQAILYGPSLAGRKILLPLDILEQPGIYIPKTPKVTTPPYNASLCDLVFLGEPARRFAAEEIHAGRYPLWDPHQFAGAPAVFFIFSPLVMLSACTLSPFVLPWVQLLAALISGVGAYFFFRRALQLDYWPAAIAAWCCPITAFFVFWQGFGTGRPVLWLPWILLAVHAIIRRRNAFAGVALAVLTCLALVSGNLDVGGQVLIVSGLYALWCAWDTFRGRCFSRSAIVSIGIIVIAWALGFMLAAPSLLHGLEYTRTGTRMEQRSHGFEERPPVGLAALPEIILPNIYGSSERGSYPNYPDGQQQLFESASAAYTGLIATLLLAPLAWCSRRHRSFNVFCVILGLFGLSWSLDLQPVVALLRLPLMNMMSHNRLVFAASFAILSMAAIGMDVLWRGGIRRRWWFGLPALLLAIIYFWSLYRCMVLPEPIATQLAATVMHGDPAKFDSGLKHVGQIKAWFVHSYLVVTVLSGLAGAGWLVLWCWKPSGRFLFPVLGVLLVGDLLWFGYGKSEQCDPALYYPRIPMLDEVAKSPPGRVLGCNGLPARLLEMAGLSDIRGYDAIDPSRLMDVMAIAADPKFPRVPYAFTQFFVPKARVSPPDKVTLSPILDMLDVRYIISRGAPPPVIHPPFKGEDYWGLISRTALPRVYVPDHVETVADDKERLGKMALPDFNAQKVAYVETPMDLPEVCKGSAEITDEIPTRVDVSVKMETAGLVVLADLWDVGWHAFLDGKPAPILRADHAIRGVIVPAGASKLEFRYQPASMALGFRIFGGAMAVLAAWLGVAVWKKPG